MARGVWLAVVAFSFVNCVLRSPPAGDARLSVVAINLLALGFIALAVAQTVASWPADLVEGRRRVRLFIVGAAALYGGLNAILQLADLRAGGRRDRQRGECGRARRHCCRDLHRDAARRRRGAVPGDGAACRADSAAAAEPDAADQKLVDALMRLMADERIYRHDNVTIGTLATKLRSPNTGCGG